MWGQRGLDNWAITKLREDSKGVARALTHAIEGAARNAGVCEIYGKVAKKNERMAHMLEACGWKQTITLINYLFGEDYLLYRKTLKQCDLLASQVDSSFQHNGDLKRLALSTTLKFGIDPPYTQ